MEEQNETMEEEEEEEERGGRGGQWKRRRKKRQKSAHREQAQVRIRTIIGRCLDRSDVHWRWTIIVVIIVACWEGHFIRCWCWCWCWCWRDLLGPFTCGGAHPVKLGQCKTRSWRWYWNSGHRFEG